LKTRTIAEYIDAECEEHGTLGERLADQLADFGGGWAFIVWFVAALFAWVDINAPSRSLRGSISVRTFCSTCFRTCRESDHGINGKGSNSKQGAPQIAAAPCVAPITACV
jgi:hypothetical protein